MCDQASSASAPDLQVGDRVSYKCGFEDRIPARIVDTRYNGDKVLAVFTTPAFAEGVIITSASGVNSLGDKVLFREPEIHLVDLTTNVTPDVRATFTFTLTDAKVTGVSVKNLRPEPAREFTPYLYTVYACDYAQVVDAKLVDVDFHGELLFVGSKGKAKLLLTTDKAGKGSGFRVYNRDPGTRSVRSMAIRNPTKPDAIFVKVAMTLQYGQVIDVKLAD